MTSSMIGLHEQQTPKPSAQLLPDVPPRFEHSELQVKVGNEIGSCRFIPAWVIEVLFLQNWFGYQRAKCRFSLKGRFSSSEIKEVSEIPHSNLMNEIKLQMSVNLLFMFNLPCVACSIP